MKVLFVAEGPNEIGHPDMAPHPRPARGVVPILTNKVAANVDVESLAIFWREIPILPKEGKRRGWTAKVAAAMLLAWRNGLKGTICVSDKDRDDDRLPTMEAGMVRGRNAIPGAHPAVCGVAVESIESWTLGAVSALATVLKVDCAAIHQNYKVADVEDFYQRSGKPEKRPKELLERIAQLGNETDSTEFRERVAYVTAIDELTKSCPRGFKPLAEKLRSAFGP